MLRAFSDSDLRYRLLGLSMAMAIGPLAEVSAYAFAPQSLLAPLDGFDVIWNILPRSEPLPNKRFLKIDSFFMDLCPRLAPYTLGESISPAKVMGTGGTVTCAFVQQPPF